MNRRICFFCRKFLHESKKRKYSELSIRPWKPVIGLEIHAQIFSASKLFSRADTEYGAPVNQQVSFFDAALPGTLPVLNRVCVEAAVKTALALKCKINKVSKFDRKHYFYADLPQGYQITQQRLPLAVGGHVDYWIINKSHTQIEKGSARVTQIQLEQDSGKSLHDEQNKLSLIDLNRAGIGLMEIVTEPDFRSGEEASAFVSELMSILKNLGTCSGKMSEGALRVDANISVHREGEPLGVRTEVKNICSLRGLRKAIEYEIHRQIAILESRGTVENETRSIDVASGKTLPMRDKEMKQDYRFMPEPNLPPLFIYSNESINNVRNPSSVVNIDEIRKTVPPLPMQIKEHLKEKHNLTLHYTTLLFGIDGLYDYFQEIMKFTAQEEKTVLNYLLYHFHGIYNARKFDYVECPLSPEHFAEVLEMIKDGTVTRDLSVKVILEYLDGDKRSLRAIAIDKNLTVIHDVEIIREACRKCIKDNPKKVENYKKGGKKGQNAWKSLIKAVLSCVNQRAYVHTVRTSLKSLLDEINPDEKNEKM